MPDKLTCKVLLQTKDLIRTEFVILESIPFTSIVSLCILILFKDIWLLLVLQLKVKKSSYGNFDQEH